MANPATLPVAKAVKGAFRREATEFHNIISKNGEFPPEVGRYVLYVSYACPWCHRCLALIGLKGLDTYPGITNDKLKTNIFDPKKIINVVNVDPYLTNMDLRNNYDPNKKNTDNFIGWRFNKDYPDPIHDTFESVWDLYKKAVPNHPNKKLTVPILWDTKKETIVNNESSEIIEMFNNVFNEFITNEKQKKLDLSPKNIEIQQKMQEIDKLVYPNINDGVYRCGFAKSQEAYDNAFQSLFKALDKIENLLSKQRYLCGNILTLSDIRLFVTLIRFDNVYYVHFKCNGKSIKNDYPNIFNYTKELCQMDGMSKYIDISQYKLHYYFSHKTINTFQIIPIGPMNIDFKEKHNRNELIKKKNNFFDVGFVTVAVGAIAIAIGAVLYKKRSLL